MRWRWSGQIDEIAQIELPIINLTMEGPMLELAARVDTLVLSLLLLIMGREEHLHKSAEL